MKTYFLVWYVCILLCLGNEAIHALKYDYSATTECLEEPWEAQYDGGIINNPKLNEGVRGWAPFGQGKIEERTTKTGNKFIVAFNRTQPSDSHSQNIQLEKGKLYAFSAWIQISQGSEIVAVIFRGSSGEILQGGTVIAEKGCWSMLKGGIVANFSGFADLTFKSQTAAIEIWADNISLQPFTEKEWRSHRDKTVSKVRKHRVKFQVTSSNNTALSGAKISLTQTKPGFPIGCEINENILMSAPYRNWFTSRFTVTAFGNEMKWYYTEKIRGQENYTVPDSMLEFCEHNKISVRGHNVLWADPRYQPTWLDSVTDPKELKCEVEKRTKSVVLRYKGRLIHWDVENENLHFKYYEDRLRDENASGEVYAMVRELDQTPVLFMNEYNTIEDSEDLYSIPSKYARKMKQIVSYGAKDLGIGLQTRFAPGQPNLAYMRAGLDLLGSMGFTIWLTEVFVDKGENQETYLEEVLKEGYSHPCVEGIVIWPTSPFTTSECKMCLVFDQEFKKNTKNGDVVDKFISEFIWRPKEIEIISNEIGVSEVMLVHGEYDVSVKDHKNNKSSFNLKIKVNQRSEKFVRIQSEPFVT